ncbi:MAG: hypothetical protein RI947_511 [Candidatus Parcubacteria bacterium]
MPPVHQSYTDKGGHMKYPYLSIEELLTFVDPANRAACVRILNENRDQFESVPGSSGKHQAWSGGYLDHITEVMNIAVMQYVLYQSLRPLPFNLGDALLVLFLHDIEKPWKYVRFNGGYSILPEFVDKTTQRIFRESKLLEYSVELTAEQVNALRYVEGEHTDYSTDRRVMNELAAFCHICDIASARIWHNHPAEDDLWSGPRKKR